MVDRWIWRILLLPLTLLFGIGVGINNLFYSTGLLKGIKFNIPVISIGNLNVGGSGKTPHVEYLIRLLSPYLPVATLSRGYKRRTSGFLAVKPSMPADQAGDEPLMYARKYRNIAVAVSENRAMAIPKLLQLYPGIRAVILDDAFQHRSVQPGLNILLTQYANPYYEDWLLPSGGLREFRSGARRADIIIVTKCPPDMSVEERDSIIERIGPGSEQQVFFTRYEYGHPYNMTDPSQRKPLTSQDDILLACGIARTDYLEDYVAGIASIVKLLRYPDHHEYSESDFEDIIRHFKELPEASRRILTTEKDAVRLEKYLRGFRDRGVDVWILPLRVVFLFEQTEDFNTSIQSFLLNFKV